MYDPFMEELKNEGMDAFAKLTKQLLDSGRTKDLSRATVDKEYRDQLMKELAIQQAQPLLPTPWGDFLLPEAPSAKVCS